MHPTFGLQDPASPTMLKLINLHDHAMVLVILVISFVGALMFFLISNSYTTSRNIYEAQTIEIIWTLVPAVLLFCLAVPSLRLLYTMDELLDPAITLKVIGHQWYWSYEYPVETSNLTFESFMVPTEDLVPGQLRLLEATPRTVLPTLTEIRAIVTSADVIHSWAVPSLGIKLDAIPGRLNQTPMFINLPGTYFGQCSEICGANHSFMPITIEAIPPDTFAKWLKASTS